MAPLEPSAISTLLANTTTKSPRESLAIEVLHNLQYQHNWTDLKLFTVSAPPSDFASTSSTPTTSTSPTTPTNTTSSSSTPFSSLPPTSFTGYPHSRSKSPSRTASATFLISGLPPRHSYIHPDLQKQLLKHDIDDVSLPVQREWVLPLSLGEKWTLRQFCWVFDGLSERDAVVVKAAGGGIKAGGAEGGVVVEWKDAKRVVLGMVAHNGMGGDGTVAYYIMQEGDVKPRQNG